MVNCNLCSSPESKVIYINPNRGQSKARGASTITQNIKSRPDKIFECTSCGLVYAVNDKQDYDSIIGSYRSMKDDIYADEYRGRAKTAKEILGSIIRLKPEAKSILEIGPACGFLLNEARALGWTVSGIEPSRWAADYAKKNFGIEMSNIPIEEAGFSRKSFDTAVMIDVIEHLKDPKSVLERLNSALKQDGILFIATPDIRSIASRFLKWKWWGIRRNHLYYFSKKTLLALLSQAGFKTIKTGFYRRYFSISYIASMFNMHEDKISKSIGVVLSRDFLKNKLTAFNLYDQLAVYAVKYKEA
jgi:2-polyprenyl-3-methyl-5-hydroxy-6-metoxy-1,4-benzoquinol methylase